MSNEHLERIEAKIDRVITTQTEHSQRLGGLDTRVGLVERALGRLDTRTASVEVTLETTIPQSIKQIAEGHAMLQASMGRGFADVMARLDERVQPIEAASRYLASQTPAAKRRRKL